MTLISTIEKNVHNRTGLTFDTHRAIVLKESIAEEMLQHGIDDMESYCLRIRNDKALFDFLVDKLTINETHFFREPAHLTLMSRRLIPELLAGKNAGKNKKARLSILSAGCSTGEEPCSIAMEITEVYGASFLSRLDILGADIDTSALDIARAGKYGKHKLRQLSPGLLSRYFDTADDHLYAVKPAILKKIRYSHVNLLEVLLPAGIQTMDIIFYRNVSIYFDKSTRAKVFLNLYKALNPGGYLVVGSSETLSHEDCNFSRVEREACQLSLVEMDGIFVYKKTAKEIIGHGVFNGGSLGNFRESCLDRTNKNLRNIDRTNKNLRSIDRTKENFRSIYGKALAFTRKKQFDSALEILELIMEQENEIMEAALVLKANVFVQKGNIEKAVTVCRQIINFNVGCAPAYLLLGIIAGMTHKTAESLKRFREAVYIQPANWLANFLIFQAYQKLGNKKAASRQAAIVVRLLEEGRETHHDLDYFPFSFSKDQIIQMCSNHSVNQSKAV